MSSINNDEKKNKPKQTFDGQRKDWQQRGQAQPF
jgi:hypothetical protein